MCSTRVIFASSDVEHRHGNVEEDSKCFVNIELKSVVDHDERREEEQGNKARHHVSE